MTKHFINEQGDYLGGFGDNTDAPVGAIEVDAPSHGLDKMLNGKWKKHTAPKQPRPDINAAIQALIDGDLVSAQAAMDKEI